MVQAIRGGQQPEALAKWTTFRKDSERQIFGVQNATEILGFLLKEI